MAVKIRTTQRCESLDEIRLPAKDREAAEALVKGLNAEPHVIAAHLKEFDKIDGEAVISHCARFQRGVEYTVPERVARVLLGYELAVEVE